MVKSTRLALAVLTGLIASPAFAQDLPKLTIYTYDGGGAITQVAQSGGTATNSTWVYTYDSRGNRLTATTTGAVTASQSLTANPGNHISNTGCDYDGGGNLISDPDRAYAGNDPHQQC